MIFTALLGDKRGIFMFLYELFLVLEFQFLLYKV